MSPADDDTDRTMPPATMPGLVDPAGVVTPAPAEITALRRYTQARIGLGRAGQGLPTADHLRFGLDHARARDAVWTGIDAEELVRALAGRGLKSHHVSSKARDRTEYLRRPDLGRQLSAEGEAVLAGLPSMPADTAAAVTLVIADGLSAAAVMLNALDLVDALRPRLNAAGIGLIATVVATQARVALGDAIGAQTGARLVVVLIGERPGLSAADGLGCYITFNPRPGTLDSARNCISNIRPGGLDIDSAAAKIAWLAGEALRRRLTGIGLKEASGVAVPAAGQPRVLNEG
ncbi:ethanolamine ammonia-lyase subunit EutC [Tistrella bauzanensis]